MKRLSRIVAIVILFFAMSAKTYAAEFFVPATGTESADSIVVANNAYNSLPKNVRTIIENAGFSGDLTAESIAVKYSDCISAAQKASLPSDFIILGITIPDRKTVSVYAPDPYLADICYHELGHAFDCALGDPSQTECFKAIYDAERFNFKNTGTNGYVGSKTTPREYFGDAFECYFTNPNYLAKNCPLTYGFVGTLILTAGTEQ